METIVEKFQNRQHAAATLASHLTEYGESDSVIAVLSENAIPVACELSKKLKLPIQFVACHEIFCPCANDKTIGSVAAETVVIHAPEHSLPQDYIYHQIRMGQMCSRHEDEKWNKFIPKHSLSGKTVIVVSDLVLSADSLLAGIMEIRNHHAKRIVIAMPVVTQEACDELSKQADDLVYLAVETRPERATQWYENLKTLSADQLISLLHHFNFSSLWNRSDAGAILQTV